MQLSLNGFYKGGVDLGPGCIRVDDNPGITETYMTEFLSELRMGLWKRACDVVSLCDLDLIVDVRESIAS